MASPGEPFTASSRRISGHTHVLLITTGSVASVKAPLIVEELLSVCFPSIGYVDVYLTYLQYRNVSIQLVATTPSLTFFNPKSVREHGVSVWMDEQEWNVRVTFTGTDTSYQLINAVNSQIIVLEIPFCILNCGDGQMLCSSRPVQPIRSRRLRMAYATILL